MLMKIALQDLNTRMEGLQRAVREYIHFQQLYFLAYTVLGPLTHTPERTTWSDHLYPLEDPLHEPGLDVDHWLPNIQHEGRKLMAAKITEAFANGLASQTMDRSGWIPVTRQRRVSDGESHPEHF